MNPHEIAEQLQEHLSHAIQQNHTGPPTIRVRLVARLGNNVIDIDQLIPLGAGTPVMPVSLADQLACVRRELSLRQRVYPRLIAQKSMTQAGADFQLAAMQAVLQTLEELQGPQSIQMELVVTEDPRD